MRWKILIPVISAGILMMTSISEAWDGETSWGSISRQTITSIASGMIDSSWAPQNTIHNWAYDSTWYYFYPGTIYTGEAYSQHNPQENWSEFLDFVNGTASGDTYYGNDCSGFVSISWKLRTRYTTSTFESALGGSYFYALGAIGKNQYVYLLQGDALNDDNNHIILFNRITSDGLVESIEQTPRLATRKPWSWSALSSYRPIRRDLVENGIKVGDRIQAYSEVNIRSCASLSCDPPITIAPAGVKGIIIEGPQNADKFRWWKIKYDNEIIGWSVEGYLLQEIDTSSPAAPTNLTVQ